MKNGSYSSINCHFLKKQWQCLFDLPFSKVRQVNLFVTLITSSLDHSLLSVHAYQWMSVSATTT